MMNNLRSVLATLLIAGFLFSLSGCGNKGPLYLPDPAEQQTQQEKEENKE